MKVRNMIKDALLSFGLPFKIGIILVGNLIVLIIALQFSLYSLDNFNETEAILEQQYYKVFDNFDDENLETDSSDFLIKIKTLYNKLYSSSEFLYLDISKQPLLIDTTFMVDDYFLSGYEKGSPLSKITDLRTGFTYNGYNSLQIDYRALKQYNLEKYIPNNIDWKADLSEETVIPVVLGYDYSTVEIETTSVYNARYLNIPFKIKIVGYFPKNSHYYNGNEMVNLDRTILIPALEYSNIAQTQDEWSEQKRIYLEKLNGIVVTNDARSVAQSKISGICAETMLPTLSIQGALSGNSVFKMQASEFAKVLILLCVILSVFATIGLVLSLIQDVTKNYSKFAVHMLCGAVVSDIYIICFVRYLFICIVSALCALFIANQIIPLEKAVVYIGFGLVLVFCVIFMIFPLSKIRKNHIGALLRRNDE